MLDVSPSLHCLTLRCLFPCVCLIFVPRDSLLCSASIHLFFLHNLMRKKRTTMTFLLALPAFALALLLGAAAFAQTGSFGGGTGTEDDPYQISTIAHLNAIRGGFLDDHFVLNNDLDFTGHRYSADDDENAKGWLPIGHDTNKDMDGFQGTEFTGSFDGGGHVIRNFSISRGGEDYIGLFGHIGSGTVAASFRNLGLEGVGRGGG